MWTQKLLNDATLTQLTGQYSLITKAKLQSAQISAISMCYPIRNELQQVFDMVGPLLFEELRNYLRVED